MAGGWSFGREEGTTLIGIVHPGSMGAAVGRCLIDAGRDVAWASTGRSTVTRLAAASAGLRDLKTVEHLAAECAVVISLCPPEAAAQVADQFVDYSGTYLEANAVSPATAEQIAGKLTTATFVDGALVGPPPIRAGTTRLYLSGPAGDLAHRLSNDRLDVRVLSAGPTAASALKMSYAAWSKGSQALLLAIRGVAVELGVDEDLLAEWSLSQPGLAGRSEQATGMAAARGWRWSYELAEVGRTFAAAGYPEGFGAAAAEIFGKFDRPE